MVTTGILLLQGKIPMVEPGIEPGTSWLVVRSSDHQNTRLVRLRSVRETVVVTLSIKYYECKFVLAFVTRLAKRIFCALYCTVICDLSGRTVFFPHYLINNKKTLFTNKLDLNLRKKLVKCYIWSMALYGAETWTLRAADQKHLESSEMWCWRRMEKISWTDHVRNENVLLRVNEQRNILHEIRKRNANWIGHILHRNCLLKHVIEGKIKGEMEVTRRRGRRRKKLLDDFKDRRGYSHLKVEALDRTMWKNRLRGGFGPVIRQITE